MPLAAALVTGGLVALAAPAVLLASPAEAAIIPASTIVVNSTDSPPGPSPTLTKVATCPAGTRVIGGGATILGNPNHVFLTQSEPRSARGVDTYVGSALEDTVGTTVPWTLRVQAICSPPIAGLTYVSKVGPDQGSGFGNAVSSCPSGTLALSAGGRINNGTNRVALSTHIEGGQLISNQTTAAGFADSATFHGWTVTSVTACTSTPIPFGDQEIARDDQNSTGDVAVATATCPAGKTVTGGSGFVPTGGVITSVNVDAARSRIQVIAHRGLGGTSGVPLVTAKAICIA
jgi:hypothetical protein